MLLRLARLLLLTHDTGRVRHRLNLHRRIADRDLLRLLADRTLLGSTTLPLQFRDLLAAWLTILISGTIGLFSRRVRILRAFRAAAGLRYCRWRWHCRLLPLPAASGNRRHSHRRSAALTLAFLLRLLLILRAPHATISGVLVSRKFKIPHHAILRPLLGRVVRSVQQSRIRQRPARGGTGAGGGCVSLGRRRSGISISTRGGTDRCRSPDAGRQDNQSKRSGTGAKGSITHEGINHGRKHCR